MNGRGKRYLIVPGKIWSRGDGQPHYVTALQLMRLYGVDPRECVVAPRSQARALRLAEHLVELKPDPGGEYRIPGRAGVAWLPLLVLLAIVFVVVFWLVASAFAGLTAGIEHCTEAAGGFWECIAGAGHG